MTFFTEIECQIEKDKFHTVSLILESIFKKSQRKKQSRMVGDRNWGMGKIGKGWYKYTNFLLQEE